MCGVYAHCGLGNSWYQVCRWTTTRLVWFLIWIVFVYMAEIHQLRYVPKIFCFSSHPGLVIAECLGFHYLLPMFCLDILGKGVLLCVVILEYGKHTKNLMLVEELGPNNPFIKVFNHRTEHISIYYENLHQTNKYDYKFFLLPH